MMMTVLEDLGVLMDHKCAHLEQFKNGEGMWALSFFSFLF